MPQRFTILESKTSKLFTWKETRSAIICPGSSQVETVIDKRDENTFESSPPLELRTIFQSTLGGNGNAVNFSNTVTITPTKRLSHTQAFCLELPLVALVNKISSISPGSCLSPLEAHSPQSPVVEYSTNSKATNSLQKNRFC